MKKLTAYCIFALLSSAQLLWAQGNAGTAPPTQEEEYPDLAEKIKERRKAETVTPDVQPEILNFNAALQQLHYPDEAFNAKVFGAVVVEVALDATGKPTEYKYANLPHESFRSSLDAFMPLLQYKPASYKGENIPCRMLVEINFDYNNEKLRREAEAKNPKRKKKKD